VFTITLSQIEFSPRPTLFLSDHFYIIVQMLLICRSISPSKPKAVCDISQQATLFTVRGIKPYAQATELENQPSAAAYKEFFTPLRERRTP
jgi:hypothetical protein